MLGLNTLGVVYGETGFIWGRNRKTGSEKPEVIKNCDELTLGFEDIPFSKFTQPEVTKVYR